MISSQRRIPRALRPVPLLVALLFAGAGAAPSARRPSPAPAPTSATRHAAPPRAPAAGARGGRSGTGLDDTLAVVGGRVITGADLVRRIEWMPWGEKRGEAGMDSAKVRALQSLAAEELLAAEAERQGLGDSGAVAGMREGLRRALARDALYHQVASGAPRPTAAQVDRAVRARTRGVTVAERAALRKAVADSLAGLAARDRAAAFMAEVLSGQRAEVDSAVFVLLADSLRALLGRQTGAQAERHALAPEFLDLLRSQLAPALGRPLVRLPGEPLRLGEVLEALRFREFSFPALTRRRFAGELSTGLKLVVEGEIMAREALRRGLDRDPAAAADLRMWDRAWRAYLLLQRSAAGPGAGDDDAFRWLALHQPRRARQACEVDVLEVLSVTPAAAAAVRASLDAGAPMDSVARAVSARPEWRPLGGRSGFFPVSENPDLGYAALLSPADSLCGPLHLPEGHSVFRVLGKRVAPDSLAAKALLEQARGQAGFELRSAAAARYVAGLARGTRVDFDYPALRRVEVLPSNMVTRRTLGFGGGMLAAPSLIPQWEWVRTWRPEAGALP